MQQSVFTQSEMQCMYCNCVSVGILQFLYATVIVTWFIDSYGNCLAYSNYLSGSTVCTLRSCRNVFRLLWWYLFLL